ncbi:hypothetical protein FF80_02598 [Devosia sp. LC5]|uniref:DUF423 domain-containing protein n=1 Tax=Devosia sp. LC5 TaxID=1502724 RepID=UPI0004E2E887|nr:DUF423 domain-containing protein [Devosia sp. LC5]KFC66336.1 hypothetical protein FF80_02598 [Devosia sp. LC5]
MQPNSDLPRRILLLAAGLAGAVGVISAAAASHAGESRNLSAIATICLAHGPALLALCAIGLDSRMFRLAAYLLAAGTLIFSADLGIREWLGHGAFAGAAPLGGAGMIFGWVLIVIGALFSRQ